MLRKQLNGRLATCVARRAAFAARLAALALLLGLAIPAAAQQAEPTATPPLMQTLPSMPAPLCLSLVVYPTYGVAPLTVGGFVELVDPMEAAEVVSYYWNFGDGNVSTLPAPMLVLNTYKNPGSYLVTLRVATADGRSATAFAGVTVRSPTPLQ